jgi:hypothetical protein
MAVGIRRADHATPLYPENVATNVSGRSVGSVRLRTKAMELLFIITLHGQTVTASSV